MSDLYDVIAIEEGPDAGDMTITPGSDRYTGNLMHRTYNTWHLSFPKSG